MWICRLLFLACFGLLTACFNGVDSDSSPVLRPDTSRLIVHRLYPNDMAKNDSAAANLARGIKLIVHPKSTYKLSFDVDPTQPAPELQLFRTYELNNGSGNMGLSRVRVLSPTVVDNQYVFEFNCEENKMSTWLTSLGVNGKYYEGEVKNISFTGVGSYSDHFSINLIVVGAMEETQDGLSIDEFAQKMLITFREKYYGVTIDTLFVRYAHNHPTLGDKYPADIPWVADRESEDFFLNEIAAWPDEETRNSLSVVMVHSIKDDGVMGMSHLFSGDMGEAGGSVVIGEHVKFPSKMELLTSDNIILTAMHEMGHFFGLRHTSTTSRDLLQSDSDEEGNVVMLGDWSNIEDGMTDTPFCEYIITSPLYKSATSFEIGGDIVYRGSENGSVIAPIYSCPDLENIMFPVTVDGDHDFFFSKQQMALIVSSLMIFPH